jgi:hypothetical protein
MRNIYPKLITTLFLILFAAMLLKFGEADSKSSDSNSKTAQISKETH